MSTSRSLKKLRAVMPFSSINAAFGGSTAAYPWLEEQGHDGKVGHM